MSTKIKELAASVSTKLHQAVDFVSKALRFLAAKVSKATSPSSFPEQSQAKPLTERKVVVTTSAFHPFALTSSTQKTIVDPRAHRLKVLATKVTAVGTKAIKLLAKAATAIRIIKRNNPAVVRTLKERIEAIQKKYPHSSRPFTSIPEHLVPFINTKTLTINEQAFRDSKKTFAEQMATRVQVEGLLSSIKAFILLKESML